MIFSFLLVLAIFELRPVLTTNNPATMISSVIYKKVQVTEDSFNKMTINNFVDDALERRRYGGFYLYYYYLRHEYISQHDLIFRLSNIVCASMCTGKDGCGAYLFVPKNCTLANATGLIGQDNFSPNALSIMMDIDIVPGKLYYFRRNEYSILLLSIEIQCEISNKLLYLNNDALDFLVDGEWDWASWSACSTTCGQGTRTRTASCILGPFYAGMPCEGNGSETEHCQGKPPV